MGIVRPWEGDRVCFKTKRLTVRLPEDLAAAARDYETAAGVSLSEQLRDALGFYLGSWRLAERRRARRSPVSDTIGRPRGPARIRSSAR
jgi:hypothetical protein